MEKFFKLKEHGTDVRTEVTAGLTTFFAMSYILFVNPSDVGPNRNACTRCFLSNNYWCGCRDVDDGILC